MSFTATPVALYPDFISCAEALNAQPIKEWPEGNWIDRDKPQVRPAAKYGCTAVTSMN